MQQPRRTLQAQRHVCAIDESRRGAAYLVAAVTMSVADRQRNRDATTQCLLPGERSWHMSKERPSRRRQALTAMAQLPVTVTIYQSRITVERDEEEVRGRCLRALLEDISLLGSCQLIIESRDEHLDRNDRRTVRALLAGQGAAVTYVHIRHEDEPLLWIADSYVWACGRGPDWRRRLHPSTRWVTM